MNLQCYEGKPLFEFDRARMFRSGLVGFSLHGSLSHYYYQFCEVINYGSIVLISLFSSLICMFATVVNVILGSLPLQRLVGGSSENRV